MVPGVIRRAKLAPLSMSTFIPEDRVAPHGTRSPRLRNPFPSTAVFTAAAIFTFRLELVAVENADIVASTKKEPRMGHRLITALTSLNAMALFACIILIASATTRDTEIAVPITRAIHNSLRMFIVGSALPTVAWAISAMEMDRSKARVKRVESWVMYILLLISLVMFVVGSWQLPASVLSGLS